MKPLRKYLTGRRGQGGGETGKGISLEGPIVGQSWVLSVLPASCSIQGHFKMSGCPHIHKMHPQPPGNILYSEIVSPFLSKYYI